MSPPELTEVGREVLRWGKAHRRDLPWRRTRDPWAVLVAEVMLQQTQAARVVERWEGFLTRWPTPASLDAVPLGVLLAWWQGLGYPRRARNLHEAAGACVKLHGGGLPDELDALLELPGVGPYTARAVLAFAFERDVAVVDTNIGRVLARSAGRRLGTSEAQRVADGLVPVGEGWAWNQTLLDVGATLCRPEPRCGECPLRSGCSWRLVGNAEPDPAQRSAGVSRRQAPYAGSARQARGAVLGALVGGPLSVEALRAAVGIDRARLGAAVESLHADGLVVRGGGDEWELPGRTSQAVR